jgi:DNA polymerase-4
LAGPREILHCDLNSFYASVEIMLDPSLRQRAVAVCGASEERRGIVLASSQQAKAMGVKTGMTNFEAKGLCPSLVMIAPKYELYLKYSRLTRCICERFSGFVEPYGIDECWLDLTGGPLSGVEAAGRIRTAVREELGLTVSVGVSFNKVFAKLGSDMRKPDATTVITPDNFAQKVWPLDAGQLLFVGRATQKKLSRYGMTTIGHIAGADPMFLKGLLGKNGLMLSRFARGEDASPVMACGYRPPIKSVGRGITCTADLKTCKEAARVMLELSQDVGRRLRNYSLAAGGVSLAVRDSKLAVRIYQARLPSPTQSGAEIAKNARELFEERYPWHAPVRSLTVRAIDLLGEGAPEQQSLFAQNSGRQAALEAAADRLRERFGPSCLRYAELLGDIKIPGAAGLPPGVHHENRGLQT